MKVFGTALFFRQGKQKRAIVAAKSRKEAAKHFNISSYMLQQYGAVTSNEQEVKLALSEPGTVFISDINYGRNWEKA